MNSGAVQLVEYFRRIDFLAESTFVLLTLSFVHLLAPPRLGEKERVQAAACTQEIVIVSCI